MHYAKLMFRSLLFLAVLAVYIAGKIKGSDTLFGGAENHTLLLLGIWLIFAIEMILRFFPSHIESMGCQKQFAKNYRPCGENVIPKLQSGGKTAFVAVIWLLLNGVLGGLHLLGVYDAGVLILLSLAFAVCDMICILFFCPFHTWIMKNKCCTTCRIYNWDYAMMFTPLVFIPNVLTYSIVAISLILLIKWEIVYKRHPERFAENSNMSLACENCQEKLCHHKKQLQHFLRQQRKKLLKD